MTTDVQRYRDCYACKDGKGRRASNHGPLSHNTKGLPLLLLDDQCRLINGINRHGFCREICRVLACILVANFDALYVHSPPVIVFMLKSKVICPMVLFAVKSNYHLTPPGGCVMANSIKLCILAISRKSGRGTHFNCKYFHPHSTDLVYNDSHSRRNVKKPDFWEDVKPSNMGDRRPSWMNFDDEWVDEVRRGLLACKVFLWYPIYCKCPPYSSLYLDTYKL